MAPSVSVDCCVDNDVKVCGVVPVVVGKIKTDIGSIVILSFFVKGHIGFVEGATPLGATWSDRMAIKFISSMYVVYSLFCVCERERERE